MFFRFAVMGAVGKAGFEYNSFGQCEYEDNNDYLKFEKQELVLMNNQIPIPEIGEELFVFKTRVFNNQCIHFFSVYKGVLAPTQNGRSGYYGSSIILSTKITRGIFIVIQALNDLTKEIERLLVKKERLIEKISTFKDKNPVPSEYINAIFKAVEKIPPSEKINPDLFKKNRKIECFAFIDKENFEENTLLNFQKRRWNTEDCHLGNFQDFYCSTDIQTSKKIKGRGKLHFLEESDWFEEPNIKGFNEYSRVEKPKILDKPIPTYPKNESNKPYNSQYQPNQNNYSKRSIAKPSIKKSDSLNIITLTSLTLSVIAILGILFILINQSNIIKRNIKENLDDNVEEIINKKVVSFTETQKEKLKEMDAKITRTQNDVEILKEKNILSAKKLNDNVRPSNFKPSYRPVSDSINIYEYTVEQKKAKNGALSLAGNCNTTLKILKKLNPDKKNWDKISIGDKLIFPINSKKVCD